MTNYSIEMGIPAENGLAPPPDNDATRLLAHLFGDRPGYVCVQSWQRDGGHMVDSEERFYAWPREAADLVAFVAAQTGAGRETYFCAHPLKPDPETGELRRQKSNAADEIHALWVERDATSIPAFVPTPTATVESSPGRFHDYWRLSRPVTPAQAEDLNRRLTRAIGGDSGWHLTKLLRPPGTRNHKYPGVPEVRLVGFDPGKSYDPGDLEDALTTGGPEPVADTSPTPTGLEDRPVRMTHEQLRVWEGLEPARKDDGSPNRSATLFKIACTLYEAGLRNANGAFVAALRERDETLGYRKYTDRRDAKTRYGEIYGRDSANM